MLNGRTTLSAIGTDRDSSANETGFADHSLTTPQARFGKSAARADESCCVYFLAGAGLIKIGVTSNLVSRLRALRNSSPVPVELLATVSGKGTLYEMKLHERFAALRRHGEWFEDDGAIREHVAELVQWRNAEAAS